MHITAKDMAAIEAGFRIRNGAWTKTAVEYVGLKYPLAAGWKERLLESGSMPNSPHDNGLSTEDWRFLRGETKDEPFNWKVTDEMEIKMRLDALDMFVSDLRKRADAAKAVLRTLRDQHSGEEW
jgi:hypothetical protein